MEAENSEKRRSEDTEIGVMSFEYEEGDTNKQMQAALQKMEKARKWFPLQRVQKEPALPKLDFYPSKTGFELLTSKLYEYICVILTH